MQVSQDIALPTILLAPLSGVLVPLGQVPDPVFAQRMAGDGVALDPVDNVLCAPCEGEVIQLHPAGHAVTVRMHSGIEVLMHIGIDTVNLKGRGFTPKVTPGDMVLVGTPLIEFDLDYVATHARSLLTLVMVTTLEKLASPITPAAGLVTVGKHTVLTFSAKEDALQLIKASEAGQRASSEAILIPHATGLHVRPCALLARAAKVFRSDVQLCFGEQHANAKSVTALLALDVRHGALVTVTAQGADAAAAVAKIEALLRENPGGEAARSQSDRPGSTPRMNPSANKLVRPTGDPNIIIGVTASPGLGVGNIFQVRPGAISIVEEAENPDRERESLHHAIEKAKGQLAALRSQLEAGGDPARAGIFSAHIELVEDPALVEVAHSLLAKGKSAAFAWKSAFESAANTLAGMTNETLAQRGNDLRDVGHRVLELLTGTERKMRSYPKNAIIVAEDLSPSDTAALDRTCVKGFCTTRGGATSHMAILAQSLGIPALASVEPRALEIPNGVLVTLDANAGFLRLRPSLAEMEKVVQFQQQAESRLQLNHEQALAAAVTLDGCRIKVFANIGGSEDAQRVAGLGGEGVGLLRSEFLFIERTSAPSEEEQFEAYKAIAQSLGSDRLLIIRTLDVGGDKPLAYLPIPAEDNPFLGERGIRIGLDRPEVLRTQLRAILRASAFGKLQVVFPMIGTLAELHVAKTILAQEAEHLGVAVIPAGIMVEIPATALMAAQFAREADFFSIGTNDLTQYTLAMDRGHPKLAPQVDGLNPAVLRLIEQSVAGAHSRGKWVGVCGGIAGDAQAVPLLVGLGVDELSVNLPAIPAVKAQIRSLRLSGCRLLAQEALGCDTAAEVRALVQAADGQA